MHSLQSPGLYVPFTQGTGGRVAFEQEYPAPHAWHDTDPSLDAYVPGKHGFGIAVLGEGQKEPSGQSKHETAPYSEYDPASQSLQLT